MRFTIPFKKGGEKSPSYVLHHSLHKPVAFFILLVFAMANTCIAVGD
jgi:NhaA family Na+:H+ antiporter